ncbi:phosphate/phosphite/phosphonate ABC transporter substrate-binding protein [Roseofilum sp. BLCC_M91]|uniref:Phosphate/phosphite/phosphonate ABC transporter substrate-binding protein n=1 Tax=Roseofilum halophilum BLCC-M91 TaxID=3022259 RepID=A0ABT7BFV8_9CYAN|nr:phosphate/phosphite/phosphonate ABC transporter substrate-binding protein [Roseofilum halophilum]MDJ1178067.1 phosphate/phosphite/phosphonate ABC transporter substrate-binding protein [Roseofilum halophilum BLCC-M91]
MQDLSLDIVYDLPKKKSLCSFILLSLVSTPLLISCTAGSSPETTIAEIEATESESAESCAPEITEVTFGILAAESEETLEEIWTPLLEKVGEAIARPVLPFYGDYGDLIESMGEAEIQIAWYGGKSYIEAAEKSQAEAFAQTVSSQGYLGYYAHLIMHKDHPLLEQINLEEGDGDRVILDNSQDLTFAFNDRQSTSGFLVPTYYLFIQNNFEPQDIFQSVSFLGSHEDTVLAVANQEVEVATNNSEALQRLKQSDPEAFENIRVVWTSPVIPGDPLAYRQDLPECLKTELQDFFYRFTDRDILEPLVWSGFDPASDRTWNVIRELEAARAIEAIKQDDTLTESEKATKLETLQQRLKELQ